MFASEQARVLATHRSSMPGSATRTTGCSFMGRPLTGNCINVSLLPTATVPCPSRSRGFHCEQPPRSTRTSQTTIGDAAISTVDVIAFVVCCLPTGLHVGSPSLPVAPRRVRRVLALPRWSLMIGDSCTGRCRRVARSQSVSSNFGKAIAPRRPAAMMSDSHLPPGRVVQASVAVR